MFKINTLIDEYLLKRKLNSNCRINLLFSKYEKIVGQTVARNTKLIKVDKETIYIICKNSVWLNELSNMKDNLIVKFSGEVGSQIFSKVFLRVGNVQREVSKPKKQLTDEEKKWIFETSERVPEGLKSSFRKLLIAYKEWKR